MISRKSAKMRPTFAMFSHNLSACFIVINLSDHHLSGSRISSHVAYFPWLSKFLSKFLFSNLDGNAYYHIHSIIAAWDFTPTIADRRLESVAFNLNQFDSNALD